MAPFTVTDSHFQRILLLLLCLSFGVSYLCSHSGLRLQIRKSCLLAAVADKFRQLYQRGYFQPKLQGPLDTVGGIFKWFHISPLVARFIWATCDRSAMIFDSTGCSKRANMNGTHRNGHQCCSVVKTFDLHAAAEKKPSRPFRGWPQCHLTLRVSQTRSSRPTLGRRLLEATCYGIEGRTHSPNKINAHCKLLSSMSCEQFWLASQN